MKKTFKTLAYAFCATIALVSCEDVPSPYPTPDKPESTVQLPAGDGTLANPYNIAAAIHVVDSLGADVYTSNAVYVKGVVSSISSIETSQYGNATFYMTPDGKTSDQKFEAYQVMGLNKEKFTSQDQLMEGDTVVVCGKIYNYSGTTPETEGKGAAYVYSINGKTSWVIHQHLHQQGTTFSLMETSRHGQMVFQQIGKQHLLLAMQH